MRKFEQDLLFLYLPDIERYQISKSCFENHEKTSREALTLLISTIKDRYKTVSERLDPLLQANKINYDLLWALFKANDRVITTCVGSGKMKCLQYQMGEEKKTDEGVEYFELQCQHLDYDGNIFGVVTESLRIVRFNGARAITSLDVYPLAFHSSPAEMTRYLVARGQKFMSLMGSHHREYDGVAFRRTRDDLLRVSVQSKVVITAEQFRKTHPSYARIVRKKTEERLFGSYVKTEQRVTHCDADLATLSEDNLVLCPATVLGFGLGDKFWGWYNQSVAVQRNADTELQASMRSMIFVRSNGRPCFSIIYPSLLA